MPKVRPLKVLAATGVTLAKLKPVMAFAPAVAVPTKVTVVPFTPTVPTAAELVTAKVTPLVLFVLEEKVKAAVESPSRFKLKSLVPLGEKVCVPVQVGE